MDTDAIAKRVARNVVAGAVERDVTNLLNRISDDLVEIGNKHHRKLGDAAFHQITKAGTEWFDEWIDANIEDRREAWD